MKLHQVKIHNLKAIRDLDVVINGQHILVTGENGVGKSTFLQAVYLALGIKKQAPPVTEGQDEGDVHVWTEEGHEFCSEVDHIKGVTKVSVKLPGEKFVDTKVSAVAGVVGGDIFYDPHSFVELSKTDSGRKKQVEDVKQLLDKETLDSINKLERQIKANEEERTETGKELKRAKGAFEESKITSEDVVRYSQEVNVTELIKKQKEISERNEKLRSVKERMDERAKKITQLQIELKSLEEQQLKAEEFCKENKHVDTAAIDEQISTASTHNTMVAKCKAHAIEHRKYLDLEKQYGEAQALIDTQREEYRNTVRSLELPIPDLTFDEEQLMYKGRAVDSNVMSTSEIMALGVMLQIAKNPAIKILVIPRCESLGREKLLEIVDMANAYGYQILGEEVVRGQGELKVEFLMERLK